jgi:molybdopterin molybdotransferase
MLHSALQDRDPSAIVSSPTAGRQPAREAHAHEALLSIEEACRRAAAFVLRPLGTEEVPLAHAIGRTLSVDHVAARACPPFDQAAMDGYALSVGTGAPAGLDLHVSARVAAGDDAAHRLRPGEAARIFTGAPIPAGADAVVMQEQVGRANGSIVLRSRVLAGEHLRRRGEDVAPGDILVRAGQRLDVRHVAILAAQGCTTVCVARRPRIAIVSTGSELRCASDGVAGDAQIYDSNRPMLVALATAAGLEVTDVGCHMDDPRQIAGVLRSASHGHHLVVTTGGVSVGEEDHSSEALRLAGGIGESLRTGMKPGKPALVGRIGMSVYLGLPGNPVSALLSWSLLGRAVLAAMGGHTFTRPVGMALPLEGALSRKAGRTEFIPAALADAGGATLVRLLSGNSAKLRPLVQADGLAEIPAEVAAAPAGTSVRFHPFASLLNG